MRLIELFEDACPSSNEDITLGQLHQLENWINSFYKQLGLEIDLGGRHFLDRINDARNGKHITICELTELFKALFKTHAVNIRKQKDGFQGVIRDISTAINIPFLLLWDKDNKEMDMKAKTILRKKNFTSLDRIYSTNSYASK